MLGDAADALEIPRAPAYSWAQRGKRGDGVYARLVDGLAAAQLERREHVAQVIAAAQAHRDAGARLGVRSLA